MDPKRPETFNHQYIWINDLRYHYVDEKPKNYDAKKHPILLMCHGFPDFWYGYRNMIPRMVQAGYRCIVPDLRGYSETIYLKVDHDDAEKLKKFTIKQTCKDLIQFYDKLDKGAFKGQPIRIVGHDWGGYVVWRFAQFFPQRVKSVASFCTMYNPPNKNYVSIETLAKVTKGAWNYQLFFNAPGASDELDENVEIFFKLFLRGPHDPSISRDPFADASSTKSMVANLNSDEISFPVSITRQEFDEYVKAYKRSSFNGGLQWYRTRLFNHEDEQGLDPIIPHTSLMVTTGHDKALPAHMASKMPKWIPNLTMKHIQDAGHWVFMEQPELASQILLEWLSQKVDNLSKL